LAKPAVNRVTDTYACDVLSDPFDSTELAAEWRALQDRSRSPCVTESFEWAAACWRAIGTRGGGRLLCFVVRRGARAAAILPMLISTGPVCRSARPLACQTDEYCPGLIDPGADPSAVFQTFMSELALQGDIDALLLPRVREDHEFAPSLRGAPGAAVVDSHRALYVRRSAFGSWDAYWNQSPARLKSRLRRASRRLQPLGELEVRELTEPNERRAAWRWMVDQRRARLLQRGAREAGPSDAHFQFVDDTLHVNSPHGRRLIFALRLKGRLIAAELDDIGRQRLEAFFHGYDPAFAVCAPGDLLRREILRQAFAQGLDYDWRVNHPGRACDWPAEARQVSTYAVALNARGRMLLAYLVARRQLARHAPARLRERLRAALA
jgi:CelD/BcsL family acetyltransferase involved in cellulose biosynthesis